MSDFRRAVYSDTHRLFGKSGALLTVKGFLLFRNFRPVLTMRICQSLCGFRLGRFFLPLFQVLHRFFCNAAAIDFPWRRDIGLGFSITHGWGAVIGGPHKIGNNVTIFHGATIGRKHVVSEDGKLTVLCVTIEDEVTVGPHAIIFGGITIGRGSRIGGGAFVTKDVPPYSVVVGNPSRVVKTGCVPDVHNPAPLF